MLHKNEFNSSSRERQLHSKHTHYLSYSEWQAAGCRYTSLIHIILLDGTHAFNRILLGTQLPFATFSNIKNEKVFGSSRLLLRCSQHHTTYPVSQVSRPGAHGTQLGLGHKSYRKGCLWLALPL